MGMTMSQKILARKAGLPSVRTGDLIMASLDLALGNDVTTPVAIEEFRKAGFSSVFNREKIAVVLDHFTPNKDIKAATQCKTCREFSREYDLLHFFDVGEMGVEHTLLPEKGLTASGELIIGADSHTCTYGAVGAFSTGVGSTDLAGAMATGKAWFKVPSALSFRLHGKFSENVSGKDLILHIIGMIGVDGALYRSMEFSGKGVASLTIDDRFTVANMAIEAGAKNGIFPVDEQTEAFLKGRVSRDYVVDRADEDAEYDAVYDIDLASIRPTIALPHLPSNARSVSELGEIKIDQVVIGSCTNGRLSDLRAAADVFRGRRAAKGVRVLVIPATQEVYRAALKEGLFDVFLDAGCAISTPTCGPCLGGHMGILAEGERSVATTNRNFVGRMGHPKSEVYLASPAVAAASAVKGAICSPDML